MFRLRIVCLWWALLVICVQGTADTQYSGFHRSSPTTLDFPTLVQRVNRPNAPLQSVEELVHWISENHSTYTSQFTWMRHSQSAQSATPQQPRTIVFGEEASFILTFAGHENAKGGKTVEIIHLNETPLGPEWEFRELDFSLSPAKLSEPNPAKCQQCHYSPLRPIWEEYETWPGAYGEFDDAISSEVVDTEVALSMKARGKMEAYLSYTRKSRTKNQEFEAFQTLMENRASHPRLQWLPIVATTAEAPYAPTEKYVLEYQARPNLNLLFRLSEQHSKVLVTRAWRHPNFNTVYPVILLNELYCDWQNEAQRRKIDTIRATFLARVYELYPEFQTSPFQKTYSTISPTDFEIKLAAWRALGIEPYDWSLNRLPSDWQYRTGQGDIDLKVMQLFKMLPEVRMMIEIARNKRTTLWEQETPYLCEDLVNRLDRSHFLSLVREDPNPEYTQTVSQMCLHCHATSEQAPKWLLDPPASFSAEQKNKIHETTQHRGPGQMPPERMLSDKEKAAISTWLSS